jgi:hypothetical protein
METSMPSISLTKKHLDQLKTLCGMGPEQLNLVLSELNKSKEIFIRLEELSSFINKYLEKESAAALATHLLSARRLADKYQFSVTEALVVLENELVTKKWDEEELKRWRAIKPAFQALAENEKIEIVAKASALFYTHSNHLHDFSIVTEMKPIFNESRRDIVGGIIENKLFLTYSDGGETESSLEISITYDELRRLREVADRAISKTDTLGARLEKSGLRIRIYDTAH